MYLHYPLLRIPPHYRPPNKPIKAMAITHPQGLRPHTMHAAARVTAPAVPKLGPVTSRILPSLVVLGAAYTVGTFIRSQLKHEASTIDRIFSQQNTPEVEQARKKDLQVEFYGDPRKNLLNILGWS